MDSFGEKIKGLRKKENKTQSEVADAVGTTQQTLRRYERGERRPDIDILKNIAKYFNASADYLLGISEYNTLDIEERSACEYIGFDVDTIRTLQYWSKNEELKAMKHIISDILKRITPDLLNAYLVYYYDQYNEQRIRDKSLKIYCEKNKLKNIDSFDELSPKDRYVFNQTISDVLEHYEIDSAQSSFKFEKMLKELMDSISIENSSLNTSKIASDESIKSTFSNALSSNDYQKEYEDITKGKTNNAPKRLF